MKYITINKQPEELRLRGLVLAPLPSHPRLGCLLFMASLPKKPLDFYTKMPTLKGLPDPFLGPLLCFLVVTWLCSSPKKKVQLSLGGFSSGTHRSLLYRCEDASAPNSFHPP